MKLEAHHRSIARAGETKNGDAVLIRPVGGATLIALIDALGHGPAAAETAAVAVDFLQAQSDLGSVRALMDGLHQKMHGTRGAAALVCVIEGAHLVGCSVGNVELRSLLDKVPAVLTPGIVGLRLRNLRIFEAALRAGERLVLFSDGLSSSLRASDATGRSGPEACDFLMLKHRRAHDDASVIVVDVVH